MMGIAEICEKTLDFGNVVDIYAFVSVYVARLDLKIVGHIKLGKMFLYHCRVRNRDPSVAVRVAE